MPKPPVNNESSKWLVTRIQGYGLQRDEAKLAFRATMAAIRDAILDGRNVNLNCIGTLRFKHYAGRTNGSTAWPFCGKPIPPGWKLKFSTSIPMSKALKNVKPIEPLKRKMSAALRDKLQHPKKPTDQNQ